MVGCSLKPFVLLVGCAARAVSSLAPLSLIVRVGHGTILGAVKQNVKIGDSTRI